MGAVSAISHHVNSYKSLIWLLWTTKTWKLLVLIFFQLVGQLLLLPILPQMMTDDFASRRAGHAMHCEEYEPKEAPASCQDAHADVVQYSTISGFFQNAIFSIIVSPALGAWSDIHGRKPVLMLSQALSIIPIGVVILHVKGIVHLYWIYVVQSFTQSVSLIAPSLAYMSDLIDPQNRAAAFGLILASFSIAILIGPPIGAALDPSTVPWVTMGVLVVTLAATYIFLPESVQQEESSRAKDEAAIQEEHSTGIKSMRMFRATWKAVSILKRNTLFVKLTVILMLSAVVGEGLQDILIQYLQIKMGFTSKDVSQMFMLLGLGALIVQGVLLQLFLKLLGEARLLGLGLIMSTCQQAMLLFATQKWHALTAIFLGSFTSVSFPTISSIKANNSQEHEQGSVQGALYGARAIASGIGPLVFAYLFKIFTVSDSSLAFFPGAPFVLGFFLMVMTTALAWTLDPAAGGHKGTLFSSLPSQPQPLTRMPTGDLANDIEERAHLLVDA